MADKKPQIITFSRRSDPAFHMEWLMESLENGSCEIPNPFNGKLYTVSLKPLDVLLFTFWTKAPSIVEPYIDKILSYGYKTAFFISQTNYPPYLEKNVPSLEKTQKSIKLLSDRLSKKSLWWRYDPIIITSKLTSSWHIENFTMLCEKVWNNNTERVIISLAHIDGAYKRIRPKLEKACIENNDKLEMPSYNEFIDLAKKLKIIAKKYEIDLEICCSPKIQEKDLEFLSQAKCLDEKYIREILPDIKKLKKGGTRKGSETFNYSPCGCVYSRDIGKKNSCNHGCVYCYANR